MLRLLIASWVLSICWSCAAPPKQDPVDEMETTVPEDPGVPIFRDAATEVSLNFDHDNGMNGALIYSEMMGAGAALFDFDRDGDLDAYLVQGGNPENSKDRLFRNQLTPNGDLKFAEVTTSQLANGYGMGVTVLDFDNDGWRDVFVSNLGINQLLRNIDGGSFEEVHSEVLASDHRWSITAAPFDYDRDGLTDLFVCNYLEFHPSVNKRCVDQVGAPTYCGPLAYPPLPDSLLRNRGNGEFEDVSDRVGIGRHPGACLGVVTGDFDGDGWVDVYVANDGAPNRLWRNREGHDFDDIAVSAGAGVSGLGSPEASMGIAAGDYDADGDLDLLVSHLRLETNTLYVNDGKASFEDRSNLTGLGLPSWSSTGFGTGWLDYDNDGLLDLVVVNGAVKALRDQQVAGDPLPLKQKNQLFRQIDAGSFVEISSNLGGLDELGVSRGAAFGDVDNDGDTDLLVINNSGAAQLLVNTLGHSSVWLGVELNSPSSDGHDRDPLAARVELRAADGSTQWRMTGLGGSYASAHDHRLLFGLGASEGRHDIVVVWPDGLVEKWHQLESRRYHQLVRGAGVAESPR